MSAIDNLKEQERVRQEYIKNRINGAKQYLQKQCDYDEAFKFNIICLDQYDFSEFLTNGRSLWNIRDAIEEKYDKEFKEKYDIYVFDNLDGEDTCQYFTSRYNVWFQEYTDWVVRYNNDK